MSKLLDGLNRLPAAKMYGTSYKEEYENIICHELVLTDKAINLKFIPDAEIIDILTNIDSLVPRSSIGYNSGLNYSVDKARGNMNSLKHRYGIKDFDTYQLQSVMQQPVMQAAPVMQK